MRTEYQSKWHRVMAHCFCTLKHEKVAAINSKTSASFWLLLTVVCNTKTFYFIFGFLLTHTSAYTNLFPRDERKICFVSWVSFYFVCWCLQTVLCVLTKDFIWVKVKFLRPKNYIVSLVSISKSVAVEFLHIGLFSQPMHCELLCLRIPRLGNVLLKFNNKTAFRHIHSGKTSIKYLSRTKGANVILHVHSQKQINQRNSFT